MREFFCALLAALVLLGLGSASAAAATPFTVGHGKTPTVAVGPDGVGHVVWTEWLSPGVKIGYCRVQPGADECNRKQLLDVDPDSTAASWGNPYVSVPAPGTVVVVGGCYHCPGEVAGTYVWVSGNNGETFSSPTQIDEGVNSNFGASSRGEWLHEPGIFVGAYNRTLRAFNMANSARVFYAEEVPSEGFTEEAEIARSGNDTLIAAINSGKSMQYAVYSGPFTTAEINKSDNWEANRKLVDPEPFVSDTSMSNGPGGVYLAYQARDVESNRIGIRHLNPTTKTFGTPSYIPGAEPRVYLSGPDLHSAQDGAGRLHVVWGTGEGDLMHTASDVTRTSFATPTTLVGADNVYHPVLGVGPSGTGVAAWVTGLVSSNNPVRVVTFDSAGDRGGDPSGPGDPDGGGAVKPLAVTGLRLLGGNARHAGQKIRLRFRSSLPGTARFTVEKRARGLKVKVRPKSSKTARTVCLPQTARRLRALKRQARGNNQKYRRLLKRKSCNSWRPVAKPRQAVTSGLNTMTLSGRKLGPGHYRLKLVVRDSAGRVAKPKLVRFRLIDKGATRARSKRP